MFSTMLKANSKCVKTLKLTQGFEFAPDVGVALPETVASGRSTKTLTEHWLAESLDFNRVLPTSFLTKSCVLLFLSRFNHNEF